MTRFFYNLYLIFIAAPILLVATVLCTSTAIIGSTIGNAHFWGYYPGKIWCRVILFVLLIPVHVEGREKVETHTSYVFVPNHQGAFDIFLVYGYLNRNFKWMLKKSLRKIPLIGKTCEKSGYIFVDKSSPTKIKETIDKAKASLVDGVSLVVFPEGARSFTGHMGRFKRGAFQMADDLQLSVVPITIDGSFDIMPRTSKWIKWHPLRMTIHDPIPPQGSGIENIHRTMKLAYEAVESALPERHKGFVENPDQ